MDCMIMYLCMCGYKVKKERRRAGDYFISLVRVTSDSFFHLASLATPEKEKRKKKRSFVAKTKLKRERERER